VADRLSQAFGKVLADQAVRDKLQEQGLQVIGGTPQQLAELTQKEIARWAQVVKESGARMD